MTMSRTTPPFRADHVGSLLRPAAVKEARAKRAEGAISAAELKAVEDREIERLVRKQEEIGLQLATDGELRRSWWHFDFYTGLGGVELYEASHGIQFAGVATKSQSIRVVGRVDFPGHPQVDHFGFLKSKARVAAKMCIPAPGTMHFRQGRQAISREIYPDLEAFFADLAAAYKKAVRAFYDAGCRYLPKGKKIVVLGLVSSKLAALDNKDDIKRRIEEAAKYAALDQLALSQQCGFASTEEGNVLTEEEQWAKLRLVVEVAHEVWG